MEAALRTDQWERWRVIAGARTVSNERGVAVANRRIADDWLEAIGMDRQPACSGYDAMKSLEMIMVYITPR
jgi:hypothetical protein